MLSGGVLATVPMSMPAMRLLSVLTLAIAAPLGRGQQAPELSRLELRQVSLDELIERLPQVEDEEISAGGEWVLRPAVAEMRDRLDRWASLSDAQWTRALLRTEALRFRSRWPAGEPFAVSLRKPAWLGASTVRLDPVNGELASAELSASVSSSCGMASIGAICEAAYQELGVLPTGRHRLAFDVAVERWPESHEFPGHIDESATRASRVLWRGPLAFDCEIVDSVDDAVPPRFGPDADAALRSSLRLATSPEPDEPATLWIDSPDAERDSPLRSMGFAVQVELLHGAEVIEHASLLPLSNASWVALASAEHRRLPLGVCSLERLPAPINGDDEALAGWSLRLTGGTDGVWRLWGVESRWQGELNVPLAELLRSR